MKTVKEAAKEHFEPFWAEGDDLNWDGRTGFEVGAKWLAEEIKEQFGDMDQINLIDLIGYLERILSE